MKCLLTGLASLLLLASPSLAFEELVEVEEGKGTTWNSGWGMMESGARLTWRVADVKTGRITLSFLIAGDDNIVTRDGLRYWSTGEVNCREGTFEYFYVYDAKKRKGLEAETDDLRAMAFEFCGEYKSVFKDSPYYNYK